MFSFFQLEFDKIKTIVAEHCHSDLGRELAKTIAPFKKKQHIEERLSLHSEMQTLLKSGTSFVFSRLHSIEPLFKIRHNDPFDFVELQKIYFNLNIGNSISIEEEKEEFPNFTRLVSPLTKLPELERRFTQIFESDGTIKDSASPKLAEIRKRKQHLRQNIVSFLNAKLEDFEKSNYLFDKIVTQRDGRYVIPLKENSASFVKGIVHGRSSSGNSIFLEPSEAVEMNNKIDLCDHEEKSEIYQILLDYTQNIHQYQTEIIINTKILQKLDFHFAVAAYSNSTRSEIPIISDLPQLKIQKARHPLLIKSLGDYSKVVPVDLEIAEDVRILLISGPNTGGKTVTLKTAGVLTLMALSGLPIPAQPSSIIGIYHSIFADIGDQQSLESALSTFSSHISKIDFMLKNSDENSLLLIDEIGAATDPEQGSALAQAVLEKLVEIGCHGIMTTHYTSLKIFAEANPFCQNAAMQFDLVNNSPTYLFKPGLPGHSYAIEVAARLGMNNDLIERAKLLSGKQNIEMTELLKKISEEKKNLSQQVYQFQLKTALLKKKIEDYEQKVQDLEDRTKDIISKSRQEAQDYLSSLQKEINSEIDQIKKSDRHKRKNLLEQSVQKINLLNRNLRSENYKSIKDGLKKITEPHIGQKVWLQDMEVKAEIVEIGSNFIKVDMDGIFFQTSLKNLFEISDSTIHTQKINSRSIQRPELRMELKILGDTFEEAKPKLDKFIDDAFVNGLERLRIVHGKGTGALRAKVRRYLHQNIKVKEFFSPPPEAGGDGVTVIILGVS
jgi:DNA mismatch repair protein MutS2